LPRSCPVDRFNLLQEYTDLEVGEAGALQVAGTNVDPYSTIEAATNSNIN
jgi:hypothetical protein